MYQQWFDENFHVGFEFCVIRYERAVMETVFVVIWFLILLLTLGVTEVNCIKD